MVSGAHPQRQARPGARAHAHQRRRTGGGGHRAARACRLCGHDRSDNDDDDARSPARSARQTRPRPSSLTLSHGNRPHPLHDHHQNKRPNKTNSLFFRREMELSLVGLQNAGKSSLVGVLTTGRFQGEDTIPTVGFNMRKVTKGGVTIKMWDLGGQVRYQVVKERGRGGRRSEERERALRSVSFRFR